MESIVIKGKLHQRKIFVLQGMKTVHTLHGSSDTGFDSPLPSKSTFKIRLLQ